MARPRCDTPLIFILWSRVQRGASIGEHPMFQKSWWYGQSMWVLCQRKKKRCKHTHELILYINSQSLCICLSVHLTKRSACIFYGKTGLCFFCGRTGLARRTDVFVFFCFFWIFFCRIFLPFSYINKNEETKLKLKIQKSAEKSKATYLLLFLK